MAYYFEHDPRRALDMVEIIKSKGTRLTKAGLVKQVMMQETLTGRIRLV